MIRSEEEMQNNGSILYFLTILTEIFKLCMTENKYQFIFKIKRSRARLLSVFSICLAVLAGMDTLPASGQIMINEFLAFNTSFNLDPEYQSYSDWLELYNNSDVTVDLSGCYITDNLSNPKKWTVPPGTEINPYGYILFWADGKNTGLHTNFKLDGWGEQIGIYNTLGNVIDSVTYPQQYSDISSGKVAGDLSWFFFQTPTPGDSNIYTGISGISSEPVFSPEGGFYSPVFRGEYIS